MSEREMEIWKSYNSSKAPRVRLVSKNGVELANRASCVRACFTLGKHARARRRILTRSPLAVTFAALVIFFSSSGGSVFAATKFPLLVFDNTTNCGTTLVCTKKTTTGILYTSYTDNPYYTKAKGFLTDYTIPFGYTANVRVTFYSVKDAKTGQGYSDLQKQEVMAEVPVTAGQYGRTGRPVTLSLQDLDKSLSASPPEKSSAAAGPTSSPGPTTQDELIRMGKLAGLAVGVAAGVLFLGQVVGVLSVLVLVADPILGPGALLILAQIGAIAYGIISGATEVQKPTKAQYVKGSVVESAPPSRGATFQIERKAENDDRYQYVATELSTKGGSAYALLPVDFTAIKPGGTSSFPFMFTKINPGDWLSVDFNGDPLWNGKAADYLTEAYYQATFSTDAMAGKTGSLSFVLHSSGKGESIVDIVDTSQYVTPPTTYQGAVYSTAQSDSQSFLRFYNRSGTAGAVDIVLLDSTTGQKFSQWTSPSIPAGAEVQYAISSAEVNAAPGASKPPFYTVAMTPHFVGSFQHVLWHISDGTLTNLSTCDIGVTTLPTRLSGVHSSLLASGYPSSIVVFNTSTAKAAAALNIFDARDGKSLGTYTTASIPANGQSIISIAAIEKGIGVTPSAGMYHYVVEFGYNYGPPFPGHLQHLVNNQTAGVVSDMTTICAMGGTYAAGADSPLRQGGVFSSAQSSSQSFLRLANTGLTAGTVDVELSDSVSGLIYAKWTTPPIQPGTAPQYAITAPEAAGGAGFFSKPSYYSVSMRPHISGTFQHVLWHAADGTLTNLSTCSGGVTAPPAQLANVHSSVLGAQGYPSSIAVVNSGSTATAVSLGIYNAADGAKLGNYTTASIPSQGQVILAVATIEAAIGLSTGSNISHYVIKTETTFTGFLQHLVNNQRAGVVSDMTTVCALPN